MVRYCFFLVIFFVYTRYTGIAQEIQIKYLGHSAFIIQFDEITVVTDYGKPNAWKEWGWDSPIHDIGDIIPDIMTYSHLHDDHYDSTRIPKGVKYILKNGDSLNYQDLKIEPISTCEDEFGDFNNNSYLFTYKGINVLHTGDIQTMIANIDNDTISRYFQDHYPKKIDLLIMPIEGKIKYIQQMDGFIKLLQPKNVIPAHYWSSEYLNEFISNMKDKNYPIIKSKKACYKLLDESEHKPTIIVLERFAYLRK